MAAEDYTGGEKRKTDHGQEKDQVTRVEHATLKAIKVRHNTEGGHQIDQTSALRRVLNQTGHRRPPGENEKRQMTTETIKLTTWLRVIAEVMQLTARYAPPSRKLPR